MVRVGDTVKVGPQRDARLDLLVRGYLACVTNITGEMAEVDTDGVSARQSVRFRAMVLLSTLTSAADEEADAVYAAAEPNREMAKRVISRMRLKLGMGE